MHPAGEAARKGQQNTQKIVAMTLTRFPLLNLCLLLLAGCAADLTPQHKIDHALASLSGLAADTDMGSEIESIVAGLKTRSDAGQWNKAIASLVRAGNRTGDPGYYSAAQIALVGLEATSSDPGTYQSAQASVLQSVHRFEEALEAAQGAVRLRGLARDYGLLGDVMLELGMYERSAMAYQMMVNLKPDALAYARAGNYRIATGDLYGAIELLSIARRGISLGQRESYAWVLARLAWCELLLGHYQSGLSKAAEAVQLWPSPGHKLLLARAHLTIGSVEQALDVLTGLTAAYPDSQALWLQAELLELTGQAAEATEVRDRLLALTSPVDPRGHAAFLLATNAQPQRTARLVAQEQADRQDTQTQALAALVAIREGRRADASRALSALGHPTPQAALFAAQAAHGVGDAALTQSLLEIAESGRLMLPPSQSSLLRQLRAAQAGSRGSERVVSP